MICVCSVCVYLLRSPHIFWAWQMIWTMSFLSICCLPFLSSYFLCCLFCFSSSFVTSFFFGLNLPFFIFLFIFNWQLCLSLPRPDLGKRLLVFFHATFSVLSFLCCLKGFLLPGFYTNFSSYVIWTEIHMPMRIVVECLTCYLCQLLSFGEKHSSVWADEFQESNRDKDIAFNLNIPILWHMRGTFYSSVTCNCYSDEI